MCKTYVLILLTKAKIAGRLDIETVLYYLASSDSTFKLDFT